MTERFQGMECEGTSHSGRITWTGICTWVSETDAILNIPDNCIDVHVDPDTLKVVEPAYLIEEAEILASMFGLGVEWHTRFAPANETTALVEWEMLLYNFNVNPAVTFAEVY